MRHNNTVLTIFDYPHASMDLNGLGLHELVCWKHVEGLGHCRSCCSCWLSSGPVGH